jgi:GNAT superfamily N-acetyltransferase
MFKLVLYNNSYRDTILPFISDFFYYHITLAGIDTAVDLRQAEADLISWLGDEHELYIIDRQGELAGFVHIWYKGQNVAWLEDIYVALKYRKQGIATEAISQAEKLVKAKDGYYGSVHWT